jgi:signal transduction histidine kinase/ligand-binding sensor domain-containing protein
MRMRAIIACSSLVFLLLTAVKGFALDPNKRLTQYQHRMWRVQDGLLPNDPDWISQTTDGYLQVGGYSMGGFRFDGVRFVPWSSSIAPSNGIIDFLPSKTGGFWITDAKGVTHVEGEREIAHFELPGTPGSGMFEDIDGSVWIALVYSRSNGGPICHITEVGARCFGEAEGIHSRIASSVVPDGKGGLWIGTDTGIAHWKSGHSEVYADQALRSNAGEPGVHALVQDSDGSLWVGIAKSGPGLGLEKFDGRNFSPFATRNFDGSKIIVEDLLMDHDQNVWVATDTGIYRIHGNTVDHFGRADGLSSDSATKLYEDREGIIWVSTTAGIDSFADRTVTTFSQPEGLSANKVSSVMASRDGTVWLANAGSLDYLRNGEVFSIRSGAGLPGFQVTSLLEDRAGQIWVGMDDGLFLYKDHHFRRLPEPNHRPLGMVAGITEDVDGNIWAECASNPRKLVRIRGFRVQEEFSSSQVPSGHTLAADPRGGIWVSTLVDGDLVRFHSGTVETFPLKLKGEWPRQIEAEPDGSVLVAAPDDGLLGLRMGNVQRLTKRNGLPCDGVLGFVRDDQKNWWLEAPCGYISVADSEMQKWWAHPDAVVQYGLFDTFDGARTQAVSFNPATKSPDGRLWFATILLQTIDPSRLLFNKIPPRVHIEQIIADHKAYEVNSSTNVNVDLPPRVRDLQIDYTALSLVAPEKVRFRYRLDGRDTVWQEPGTRRQAFYTDLRPGKYSFRVIACNNSGVWNEAGAILDFNIEPAWYQTSWFRVAFSAAFLLLIWSIYRLRVRQLRHQFTIGLEARVSERTRIARDLHDTLLQSFHGLLLHFQAASNLLPTRPNEAKKKLDHTIDLGSQAIAEGRGAIQGLRSSTVMTNDLAVAIRTLAEELAASGSKQKSPVVDVAVEGTPQELHPLVRDEVHRIAAEALRNAFRHAHANRIEVEISYDTHRLRLRVRDDGKGIEGQVLTGEGRAGHWGLHGMRERAKLVGGEFEVWSKVNSGTEIELAIPASVAYVEARTPRSS